MSRLLKRTLFILVFMLFPLKQVAAIGFEDAVFPELIANGRALAMGNAFICKVDDASAPFYNPAGLGTVRWAHFHLSNLHLETNKDWVRITSGGKFTDAAGNFMDGFSIDGQRKLLQNHLGKIAHTRYQFAPNFTARYFSFGYLFAKRTRATIPNADGSEFEYAKRQDHGPYASLNLSLFGGVFKLGAAAFLLARKEAIGTSPREETVELEDSDHTMGNMLLVNVGTRVTLPVVLLPTFAAVMHNANGGSFTGRHAGAPSEIKTTFDIGASITPQIGKTVRLHLEANWKDVAMAHSDVKLWRKIVFGAEIDIMRRFFFRFGYGDGYGSGGIGVRARTLEFDLTTYAVDTSDEVFRGKEDRRFALSISTGL